MATEEALGAAQSRRVGRRRAANARGGRQHRHEVKVTAEEEAQLQGLAAEQGVTVPRLLVESALAGPVGETASERRALLTELFAVHRTVAGVANNVNQIARKLHVTDELAAETSQVLEAARSTMQRIDAVIDRLGMS